MAEMIDEKYFDDYDVLTPNGWKDFKGIGKTIKYNIWNLKLENGLELQCADNHIVITKDGEKYTKDLTCNDYLETINGFVKVSSIEETDIKENMYDLLDVDGSIYYTNDISSHNSTVIAIYALWYAIFHPDKTIGIVSNKALSAIDIMSRIKILYEELPSFLKPGVKEYSKTFTTFDNESKIIVSATSADAFRGRTLNLLVCLGGENYVTVRDKNTGEIKNITIEDLYSELNECKLDSKIV